MTLPTDLLGLTPLYPVDDETAIRARWNDWANEGVDASQAELWTDVREGSIFQACTQPGVQEAARIYDLAGVELVAAGIPLLSFGAYLDAHAVSRGLERLAATAASGAVTFTGPAATVIPAGTTVAVEPTEPDADAPEYETIDAAAISAVLANITGLGATPSGSGGTLAPATYAYKVSASDGERETLPSAQVTATIGAGPSTGSVALNWDDVPGALAYHVYRGPAGGPWLRILTVAVASGSAAVDTGYAAGSAQPAAVNATGTQVSAGVRALEAGSQANVSAGAVSAMSTPLPGVTVINLAPILGGTDPESDELLLERLIEAYSGGARAGTRRDYERWARAYPGVGRAAVIPEWAGPGTVKVIITAADGQPASAATVGALQAFLDPSPGKGDGEAPISAIVTVTTAAVLNVTIAATVEAEPGYSLDGFSGTVALRDTIAAELDEYVHGVVAGGEIVIAKAIARIASIAGVHDVGAVTINGAAVNLTIDDDPAQSPVLVLPPTLTAA